jgi:hypothetical protein
MLSRRIGLAGTAGFRLPARAAVQPASGKAYLDHLSPNASADPPLDPAV